MLPQSTWLKCTILVFLLVCLPQVDHFPFQFSDISEQCPWLPGVCHVSTCTGRWADKVHTVLHSAPGAILFWVQLSVFESTTATIINAIVSIHLCLTMFLFIAYRRRSLEQGNSFDTGCVTQQIASTHTCNKITWCALDSSVHLELQCRWGNTGGGSTRAAV